MIITFKTVHIENFKSIGEADIDLQNRGIIAVSGRNDYEDNASSNGSGKSSIFAAVFWCLYGKTPDGVANPSNRYRSGSCIVDVNFDVDNTSYRVIRRIQSSQSVELYVDGEDQSSRNKTDTDKKIRDDIIRMSADLFLSLIYLSQGYASRMASLTPSERKDRLEQLTDTVKRVDAFNEKLSDLSDITERKSRLIDNNCYSLRGQISTYQSSNEELIKKLSDFKNQSDILEYKGSKYTYQDMESVKSSYEFCCKECNDLYAKVNEFDLSVNKYSQSMSNIVSQFSRINKDISECNEKLKDIDKQNICPTCRQQLNMDNKEFVRQTLLNKISDLQIQLADKEKELEDVKINLKDFEDRLSLSKESLQSAEARRSDLNYILSHIPIKSDFNVDSTQSIIDSNNDKIEELNKTLIATQTQLDVNNSELSVIKHCRLLVTKSFRSYLLASAISYLNNQLDLYSCKLFSNTSDKIRLSADSQKLDIYLGDALYDTLSGGEKRRVDIALTLAQRDLASAIAGMSCNILILDEIMESMDEQATQVTLDLLEQTAQNVDSMFIISHNDYALPIDGHIYVTKGKDRVATVQTY